MSSYTFISTTQSFEIDPFKVWVSYTIFYIKYLFLHKNHVKNINIERRWKHQMIKYIKSDMHSLFKECFVVINMQI